MTIEPWAWLIAGVALAAAELAVPGVFLVFLAMAAAITGLAVLALPALPLAAQVASFAVWSVVAVAIGRRWYRDFPVDAADPLLNDRAARLVGQIVTVERAIVGSDGRVRVGDGSWPARGDDAAVGETVRVVAVDGATLVVERRSPFPPGEGRSA